jgi:hypothetical protein
MNISCESDLSKRVEEDIASRGAGSSESGLAADLAVLAAKVETCLTTLESLEGKIQALEGRGSGVVSEDYEEEPSP